jgi:hypothetical protein
MKDQTSTAMHQNVVHHPFFNSFIIRGRIEEDTTYGCIDLMGHLFLDAL